jgi:hypothetical protein
MELFLLPAYEAIRKTLCTSRSVYRHPRLNFCRISMVKLCNEKTKRSATFHDRLLILLGGCAVLTLRDIPLDPTYKSRCSFLINEDIQHLSLTAQDHHKNNSGFKQCRDQLHLYLTWEKPKAVDQMGRSGHALGLGLSVSPTPWPALTKQLTSNVNSLGCQTMRQGISM